MIPKFERRYAVAGTYAAAYEASNDGSAEADFQTLVVFLEKYKAEDQVGLFTRVP